MAFPATATELPVTFTGTEMSGRCVFGAGVAVGVVADVAVVDVVEVDFPATATDVPVTFTGAETTDFLVGVVAGGVAVEDDFPRTAADVPVTVTGGRDRRLLGRSRS